MRPHHAVLNHPKPTPPAGFDFCYYDFDTGPMGSMTETMEACGLDTRADGGFFMHGKLPLDGHQLATRGSLCEDIATEDFMGIEAGWGGSQDCVRVRGLKEGRGSDNPQKFSDVMMGAYAGSPGECYRYDICPADGVSGYRRPPGKNPDIIECSAGGDGEFRYSPAAGLYPPSHRLAGAPYRYTLPKFVCLMYPPGTSSWTVTYSVTSHTEAKYGRNFLFAGSGTSRECLTPPPSPPPSPSPPRPRRRLRPPPNCRRRRRPHRHLHPSRRPSRHHRCYWRRHRRPHRHRRRPRRSICHRRRLGSRSRLGRRRSRPCFPGP